MHLTWWKNVELFAERSTFYRRHIWCGHLEDFLPFQQMEHFQSCVSNTEVETPWIWWRFENPFFCVLWNNWNKAVKKMKYLPSWLHCTFLNSIIQFVQAAWYHIYQACLLKFFKLVVKATIGIGAIHRRLQNVFISYVSSILSWTQSSCISVAMACPINFQSK